MPELVDSSSDAELRALDECARELEWLPRLDNECHPARTTNKPIVCYEDNNSCIRWIKNPCDHSKVKHIDVPLKYLRDECMKFKNIDLKYINTKYQLADAFTKQLPPTAHWRLFNHIMNIK